ncbi:hypothetical protein Tco_1532317, partial [Tanacetum coccineum]
DSRNVVFNEVVGEPFVVEGMRNRGPTAFISEEDPSSTPSIPESVVKIATMEIDLEAPIALEPETDDTHEDIIKAVVEAIISISSFEER